MSGDERHVESAPCYSRSPAAASSCATMRATRASSASVDSLSRKISTISGNANGVGRFGVVRSALLARSRPSAFSSRGPSRWRSTLPAQPAKQQVARSIARRRRRSIPTRLQLPLDAPAGIALEDEPACVRSRETVAGRARPRSIPQNVALDVRRSEEPAQIRKASR